MMGTKVSYARAMPTSKGTNLSLNVEKLRTKCKEMIFKAYRALGKPNGHDWVVSKSLEFGVMYNVLISIPIRSTQREIELRRVIRRLQVARMERWHRANRATRKQMLLKRIDEILAVIPDYPELKTLKTIVRYAK